MVEVEKDYHKEYASKGVAGAALGTGIAGLSLSVLNSMGGLGAMALNNRAAGCGCATGVNTCGVGCCSENMPVSRYELDQSSRIAQLESQIALRDANTYGDQKALEMYKYFDAQLKQIREQLCAQAVHNQKTEDSFTLVSQDVASVRSELHREIEMEAERRCCGDNSIVTYANATFYPKQIANVTTGTTTTAQTLYNPLPKCGDCCCDR